MGPLDTIRAASRPVMFRTHLKETPFGIAGSSFLIGGGSALFAVTAKHVIDACPVEDVLIFPSNKAKAALGFAGSVQFEDDPRDADSTDLILLRINQKSVKKKEGRRSHVINLQELETSNWYPTRDVSTFFLIGYPKFANYADYDSQRAMTTQVLIAGKFRRPGMSEGCYELDVQNVKNIESFDGLSGGPVFSVKSEIGIGNPPLFCGMVIRGGAEAKRIYFLGASTIRLAIESAADA